MMSDDAAIKIENLSKKFCRSLKRSLWYGIKDIGRELTAQAAGESQLRNGEFWALKDVSLEIKRGEIFGLIGPNGSGKSTLLKLISGVIKPDSGTITINGRVQCLITLGVGFNPLLSGRENIFVNAAMLNIPRREVLQKLDSIVAFSELEGFMDAPLMSYSSGMKARLAFSVAVHSNPDILLVDEVLSVGDLRFRRKAQREMLDLLHSGATVVFVSHGIDQIKRMCSRTAYLAFGDLRALGDTDEVVLKYVRDSMGSEEEKGASLEYLMETAEASVSELLHVRRVVVADGDGERQQVFVPGDDVAVRIDYVALEALTSLRCIVQICRIDSTIVASSFSDPVDIEYAGNDLVRQIECVFKRVPLSEGLYQVSVAFQDSSGRLFAHSTAASFEIQLSVEQIENMGSYRSLLHVETSWEHLHDSRILGAVVGN